MAEITRDPAKVTRYQEAVKRIATLTPGTPEYTKNADIIKTIGTEYGYNWQPKIQTAPTTQPPVTQPPAQQPVATPTDPNNILVTTATSMDPAYVRQQQLAIQAYIQKYPDVRKVIEDLKASGDPRSVEQLGFIHYASNGASEGRTISLDDVRQFVPNQDIAPPLNSGPPPTMPTPTQPGGETTPPPTDSGGGGTPSTPTTPTGQQDVQPEVVGGPTTTPAVGTGNGTYGNIVNGGTPGEAANPFAANPAVSPLPPPTPEQPVIIPGNTAATLGPGINTAAAGLSVSDKAALERAKALLTVGEQYGRQLGDEFYADGSLGRVYEQNTPEELAALERLKALSNQAGVQSQDVKSLLAQQQGILTNAQELSPLELEALGVARNALPGLDTAENQALRSQAQAEILRQSQGQARELARAQARSQVFGGAATAQNAQLARNTVQAGRELERDLLIKNIDIKAAAQKAFGDLATATESNRAGRTDAASRSLSGSTLTDENNRKSAAITASANQGTLATSLADRLDKLREFNLGQAAAEKAGRIGSLFGGVGAITDQRGLLAGEDFADKQYQDSQKIAQQIIDIYKKTLADQRAALG